MISQEKRRRIKKYLKDKIYKYRLELLAQLDDLDAKDKLKALASLILNILVTGLIIEYAVERRNFISYGLLSIVITYYFRVFVLIIKGKEK